MFYENAPLRDDKINRQKVVRVINQRNFRYRASFMAQKRAEAGEIYRPKPEAPN